MLDENHQLCKLSDSIDWCALERDIVRIKGSRYKSVVRLVCSSIYLNSFYELSSADVIEKWSSCPYCRYFCSGDIVLEDAEPFPIPQHVLDALAYELDGEGHDAMIKALREISGTIH